MLLLCISKTSLFSFNPDIVTHELVTLEQIIQLKNLFSLKQSWPRLRGAHNRPPLLVSVRLSPWQLKMGIDRCLPTFSIV